MKMKNGKKSVALLSGAVMLTSTLGASVLTATPARAADTKKSKQFKTGAIALGALAAYFALKGKTVPAAAAAAGGYYVYKKSQDEKNRYGSNGERYPGDPYYASNSNGDVYPSGDTSGAYNGNYSGSYNGDTNGDYASGDNFPADDNGAYASYPDDNGYDGGFNGFNKKAKNANRNLPTVLK